MAAENSERAAEAIGRVVSLWRYPVKSMAEESLEAAEVSWHGVAGDRRWAFVRAGQEQSGFPWLTLRQRSDLRSYRPSFADPERPDESRTLVGTPSGQKLEVTDPALAAELGAGVRVIKQNRGIFDTFPLSLITRQTLSGLGELTGLTLDEQRFRPNFVVEAFGSGAFPEDGWVGHVLSIGGMKLRVDRRDSRCVIVNLDPRTGTGNPAVLRAIAGERGSCAGVYASVVQPGRVSVGDAVTIERQP